MPFFRKKPVEIEAMLARAEDWKAIEAWSNNAAHACGNWRHDNDVSWFSIKTLEGEMTANLGDWIIRGVKGEFYPCKPDIFEQTYDPT